MLVQAQYHSLILQPLYQTVVLLALTDQSTQFHSMQPTFGKVTTMKLDKTKLGKVTAWLTVTDSDFTSDTLTTSSANIAGKILVKLIETSATHTCFTAGGLASADASGSTEEELGPLSEIEIGTSSYEVSLSLSKIQDCGSTAPTITSGDILQVE